MKRHIYRNCATIVITAELLTLSVIGSVWLLLQLGHAVFGDPLTNAVVSGTFTLVGAQLALAGEFAPREEFGNDGSKWYPNVHLHVGVSVLNIGLVLAMGVYAVATERVAPEYVIVGAVVGLVFAAIAQLNSLAARFIPRA